MDTSGLQTGQTTPTQQHKYACSSCARRKVKCDKDQPCANCAKACVPCTYDKSVVARPRKRAADEDLLARLARYEDLLRKNGVDFETHTWVVSGFEKDQGVGEERHSPEPASGSRDVAQPPNVAGIPEHARQEYSWASLTSDLKFPPAQTFFQYHFSAIAEVPLHLLASVDQPKLDDLHPETKLIFRCWDIFVERVDPLLKIVHVPSLRKRLMDAAWDPRSASKTLTATLFTIYALAVKAASADECETMFRMNRSDLIHRFQAASFRALLNTDFLVTRCFEVLQAFVLFLFVEPDSELTYSLTGAAVKVGLGMGLNRTAKDAKISILETELRIRLWWQLNGLDSRTRFNRTYGKKPVPTPSDFGGVRLPLNLNDTDLHPDMTEFPQEHNGPTEMSAVLMKFEIFQWYRSFPKAATVFAAMGQTPPIGFSMPPVEEAIREVESIYQEKFLRHLDLSIPLHKLTYAMAKLSIARMRFRIYHPRSRGGSKDSQKQPPTREESDVSFEAALTWIEMVDSSIRSGFAPHLVGHFTTMSMVDAYIYVISELRWRTRGPRVATAWRLIEGLYHDYPTVNEDSENKLFAALGDLTLTAWEARQEVMMSSHDSQPSDATTPSILALWNRKQTKCQPGAQSLPGFQDVVVGDLDFSIHAPFEWEPWNEFLRL